MNLDARRIRHALKAGKEIDVVERGTDQVMTAFEHPYLKNLPLLDEPGTEPPAILYFQRDTRKAKCYWYRGEQKMCAVFNLENLMALP